jgi:hypothetical protein
MKGTKTKEMFKMGRYQDVDTTAPVKQDTAARSNKPMKAGQVILNMEVLQWLQDRLDELAGIGERDTNNEMIWHEEPIWDDEVADSAPSRILDELEKIGWTRYQDNYGDHAYASIRYACSTPARDTDELRLNVVLKKGVIHLDLRPWGWYDESDRSRGRWNRS